MKMFGLLAFLLPLLPVTCAAPAQDTAQISVPATTDKPVESSAPVTLVATTIDKDGMRVVADYYPEMTLSPKFTADCTAHQLWINFDPGHRRPTIEVSADGKMAMFTTRMPIKAGRIQFLVLAFRRFDGHAGLVRIAGTTTRAEQRNELIAAVRKTTTTATLK